MSEENVSPESENTEPVDVETQVRLTTVEPDGANIADATRLRLEVEGDPLIVSAAFEIVLSFTQQIGGVIDRAVTESGEDVTDDFRPPVVDLLDAGDEPVA